MAENSDIDPLEERFRFTPEALELRRTLDFDPRVSKKHLKLGNWNDDQYVRSWEKAEISDFYSEIDSPHVQD